MASARFAAPTIFCTSTSLVTPALGVATAVVDRGMAVGSPNAGTHRSNTARVAVSTDDGSARNRSYSSRTYPSFTPPMSVQSGMNRDFIKVWQVMVRVLGRSVFSWMTGRVKY
jgi:hypothetical protein